MCEASNAETVFSNLKYEKAENLHIFFRWYDGLVEVVGNGETVQHLANVISKRHVVFFMIAKAMCVQKKKCDDTVAVCCQIRFDYNKKHSQFTDILSV